MKNFCNLTPLLGLTLSCGLIAVTATPVMALEFDKKLVAPDGEPDDQFGVSVSVSGNTALISSFLDDDNGFNSGSAYLFNLTTGNFLRKLTAPDGEPYDEFGLSGSLSGNIALIGSPGDDRNNGSNTGSAYLFDVTTGDLLHKLTPPDEFDSDSDPFGDSVSVSGNIALVGAYLEDDLGSSSGSAYLFDVTTGDLLHKLTAPDGAANDYFGWSLSVNGNMALVGAYLDDDHNGENSGSAYLFDVTTGNLLQFTWVQYLRLIAVSLDR